MVLSAPSVSSGDRRTALKERSRRAILAAANDIITEHGLSGLSVDQLATHADISRRTIFNHFASIDDVVTTVCTEKLGVVIEEALRVVTTRPVTEGSRAAMFEDVATALRETDIPTFVAFLWRALGGFDAGDPRPLQLLQATISRTADDLARELALRNTNQDRLEADLIVSSLLHGTGVIVSHWISATGATTDTKARAIWDQLLERLIETVRAGYPNDR